MLTKSSHRKTTLIILGLAAGFLSSALGIGGGVVIVPVMVTLLGFDIKKAAGTSLATIIPTATFATICYLIWDITKDTSNIQFKIALIAAIGAIAGSWTGVKISQYIHSSILKYLFILLLVFVGLKFLDIIEMPIRQAGDGLIIWLLVAGFFAGIASALFGIGGGVIMVPILTLFFVKDIHQAIPTSLLIIIPTSIAGTLFHKKLNNVDTAALKILIPLTIVSAIAGVFVKNSLPSDKLKVIFGVFVLVMALKMLIINGKKSK